MKPDLKRMKSEIFKEAHKHGNLITTAQAVNCGVSKTMLSKYVDSGALTRIEHGIYALPDTIIDNLLVLHLKNRNIIFSHESALFLNGIASRTPFAHTVTVESQKTLPTYIKEKCTCFYVDSKLFKVGLTQKKTTFGNLVPCYNAERTICDILRSRNRMDEETVVAAIKNYAAMPDKNLFSLYEYATKFSVLTTVKRYMEVLL